MPSPAIGSRNLDLFIGADVELYNPATDTTTTVYWSNKSWLTNVDDSVAANRQYVGLLAQCFQIDYSWFSGDTIGGRSTRNFGALRAINADGHHSLDYIFEDGLKVQGRVITYRIGRIGDDLGTMITYTLTGRHIRQSEDGHEVVIDLSDDGQALDTSVLVDKFQGLGAAVRHELADVSTIPDDAALNPTSAWYLHLAYRLPSWSAGTAPITVVERVASGGGHVYQIEFDLDSGDHVISIRSRTAADATVTLTVPDLLWVADGRFHQVAAKWDNTTDTLRAFHSTRTGGALSEVTAAQATIKAGSGDLLFGDCDGLTFTAHEQVDIAFVALALDANVPTDAEILDRMKRPFTDAEIAACEVYLSLDERTGTHAFDESVVNAAASDVLTVVTLGNGNTVTIDGKVYTAESVLTNVDGHFDVGADDHESIENLVAAINLGPGSGTAYAALTTVHPTVFATDSSASATGTLTVTTAADGDTVTIDGKVYTLQDTLTNVNGNVKVGATDSDTIDNLIAAINLGAGSGTLYAAAMTLHATVSAAAGAGDTMTATAKTAGTSGNAIGTTDGLTSGSWAAATLTGGTDTMTATARTAGTLGNAITVSETLTDGSWATANLAGGVGHTATVPDAWVETFEGPAELAGTAKPLSFGRIFNAPITWADREQGAGVIHARCFKGVTAAYEGAKRLIVGWPKMLFRDMDFDAATDTISFSARSEGGADRLHAQAGFSGLVAGQQIVVVGTASNDGTYTLDADSTERTISVAEALMDESSVDAYVTALDAAGGDPDVELWHEAGGILFNAIPTLPVSFEVLGDIGAEIGTDDSLTHFPEYAPAIMRTLMEDWAGFAAADLSDSWDNGDDTPAVLNEAYYSPAGVWLDGARDRTLRDVLDDGAATVWARWGQRLANDTWDLIPIEAPTGTADIDLTSLEILGLRRLRSIPPVGGIVLRSVINYAPLREGEVAGAANADDAAALRREHFDAKAAIDSTVAAAYPFAETPAPITTWLRYQEDARVAAQERYDVLKVEREMYDAEAQLYGLDQNPLAALVTLTDEDFGTLVAGKDFHLVHLQASDEATTLTGWG